MMRLKSIGGSPGYAIGPARVLDREEYAVRRKSVQGAEVDAEVNRFLAARDKAVGDLKARLAPFTSRLGPSLARIIEGYVAILADDLVRAEVEGLIRGQLFSAEYALSHVYREQIKRLGDDPGLQRFRDDLVESERGLMRALVGRRSESLADLEQPSIIVAHWLGPGQVAELVRGKVVGLMLDLGGPTSHVAIVARSLNIPTVLGLESASLEVTSGDTVIVDGTHGVAVIDPDEPALQHYRGLAQTFVRQERELVEKLRDVAAETRDGQRIGLFGNIEYPKEIVHALEQGAEGIGLYRTEYMVVEHGTVPDEAYHFDHYRSALKLLGGKPLIVRTFDLGADKVTVEGIHESNPFLGTRAIRLCFARPDMFRAQLRAILRASGVGPISMMIPLVTAIGEVRRVRDLLEELKTELKGEGVAVNDAIPVGAMIETPASVEIADLLAPHVDFFSIGTNDLIATTLAVDRTNEHVAHYYQPHHPAILRMMQRVFRVGEETSTEVSLCGEMGSDLRYTMLLLGLGLRKFSVVPPIIPEIKRLVRAVTLKQTQELAARVMAMDDPDEIEKLLNEEVSRVLPPAE